MFKNRKLKLFVKSPFFILSLFLIFFFFPIFFQNEVFYIGDILTIYLPFKKFLFRNLSQGIFPLWNPNIFSGYPFFADMTLGTYYPPSFILFFSQSMKNVSFLMIFHFFISAFFMYRLGRLLKLSENGALFGSIAYTFSGIVINYIADPQRFFVISLYPLFFYTFLKALEKKNFVWIIIASLSLSLQFFAGHIQYVFIELLFCPLLLSSRLSKNLFKKSSFRANPPAGGEVEESSYSPKLVGREIPSGCAFRVNPPLLRRYVGVGRDDERFFQIASKLFILTLIIILAFLFSSISLIPTLEFIPLTTRIETYKHLSIYQSFSLAPVSIIRFFIAHFWGIKSQGSAWGTMDTSTIGYIGFIPLFLIILTFKKLIKKKESRIFLIISFISLFISFGTFLPFFKIFVNIIPLFVIFRNPMVFLTIYTFFMAILSGFASDFFLPNKRTRRVLTLGFIIVFFVSSIAYLAVAINRSWPYFLLTSIAGFIHKNLSSFHTKEVDFLIANFILTNIMVVAVLGSVAIWFKRKEFLIFAVFIDLFLFTRSNFYTIDASFLTRQNKIVSFLKENLSSYRYLSSSEVVPYSGMNDYFGMLSFQPPFAKEGKKLSDSQKKERFLHELTLLPPNFSTFYGLSTINGYTSFVVKKYNDIFQESKTSSPIRKKMAKYNPYVEEPKPEMILSKVDLSKVSFNDEIFDRLSVKYIVTDRDLGLTHHELAYKDGDISVYENGNAQPRVVLLGEKENTIEEPVIVKEDANQIEIKTKKKGKLVLYDVYYSGWKAFVDGREVPIATYKQIFRGIDVDKENSNILFQFRPFSFYLGAGISVISLFFAFLYLGVYVLRCKR